MNLQEIIIKRYFEYFPKQSLREISAQTGIQITRVFRILNGSSMKLCEYEAFEEAICKIDLKSSKTELFLNLSKDCLRHLSEAKISEFMHEMSQAVKIKKIIKNKENNLNTNQFA